MFRFVLRYSSYSAIMLAVVIFSASESIRARAETVMLMTSSTPALADGLQNGDTISVGGVSLTFSNVVVSDGSASGTVEGDGILISNTSEAGLTDVHRFDFTLNQDLVLTNYSIGLHEDVPSGSFFTIAGAGGVSGNNTIPANTSFTEQSFAFDSGTMPSFQAGEVYSFTHNLPDAAVDPLFDLRSFTFASVPEPSSAGLLFMTLVGLSRWRRTRCR